MTSTGVVLRLDGERWNFHPSPTGHTRHIRHTVRTAANLQVRDLHAVLAGAPGGPPDRHRHGTSCSISRERSGLAGDPYLLRAEDTSALAPFGRCPYAFGLCPCASASCAVSVDRAVPLPRLRGTDVEASDRVL